MAEKVVSKLPVVTMEEYLLIGRNQMTKSDWIKLISKIANLLQKEETKAVQVLVIISNEENRESAIKKGIEDFCHLTKDVVGKDNVVCSSKKTSNEQIRIMLFNKKNELRGPKSPFTSKKQQSPR